MADTTLTPKSVRIAEDEAKWLSAAATKGAVTQNDLIRLAVHRLRKELGAAKPHQARDRRRDREGLQVQAHPAADRGRRGALGRHGAFTSVRGPKSDAREGRPAPHARSHQLKRFSRSRGIDGASPCTRARERGWRPICWRVDRDERHLLTERAAEATVGAVRTDASEANA